jgi:hypothetical protein
MIQMEDEVYEKLKKNADDNRQVKNIVRLVLIVVCLLVLYFGVISKFIDIQMKKYDAEIQREVAIAQAETNVKIREIESSGMSMNDYIRWLAIQKKYEGVYANCD